MANTYTQLLYHIVFSTKNRERAITAERRDDLYRYMWGIHRNLKCHLYRIGGTDDHVHILTSIHPTLALSKYIEQVKTSSTHWVRDENIFPGWPGWQDGYSGFTISNRDKDPVIEYIKGQEAHHLRTTFLEEYRALLAEHGVEFDERYLA